MAQAKKPVVPEEDANIADLVADLVELATKSPGVLAAYPAKLGAFVTSRRAQVASAAVAGIWTVEGVDPFWRVFASVVIAVAWMVCDTVRRTE